MSLNCSFQTQTAPALSPTYDLYDLKIKIDHLRTQLQDQQEVLAQIRVSECEFERKIKLQNEQIDLQNTTIDGLREAIYDEKQTLSIGRQRVRQQLAALEKVRAQVGVAEAQRARVMRELLVVNFEVIQVEKAKILGTLKGSDARQFGESEANVRGLKMLLKARE
ncbi:hypothetical protein SS50377_27428 [Spironucleus salmonicida]|uniref:Uncharacterized protein n=1 Tax=Spironucleus salmonicida TaxID=348837 RepID=V6LFL1_9EUKA|nr:hypothetical protein SS50377_27428 [Spironucleus salmonicida]|eukprot:EST43282.1 Hypothetical protein SS50377_16946 [Spironucleus salmonicida]